MHDIMERINTFSTQRPRQIEKKLDKLEHCTSTTEHFQLHQDIVWNLEQYMRDIRDVSKLFIEDRDDRDLIGQQRYGLQLPNCCITDEGLFYRIRFGAILPYKTLSRCDLLCADLTETIACYIMQEKLKTPVFQTAVVVFCHHYRDIANPQIRLRDYDNLERKCILDTLHPSFFPDDNPRTIRTADMMLPSESDFTDILIMDWHAYQAFILRKSMDF